MKNNQYPNYVMCPLINEEIEAIDCIVVSDCAEGLLKETAIKIDYTLQKEWKKICKNCENRRYR